MKHILFLIIIFLLYINSYNIFTLSSPFIDPDFSKKVTLTYDFKEKEKRINNALKITIVPDYEDSKYKVIFHYAPGVHRYFFEQEGTLEYYFNKEKLNPINAIFYDKNLNILGETTYDFNENKYIVTNYTRHIVKKNINFNNYPIDNWTFFIFPSGLPLDKLITKEIESIKVICLYGDICTNKESVKFIFIGEKILSIKAGTFSAYELYYKFDFILASPYSIKIWIDKKNPHYFFQIRSKKKRACI